MDLTKLYERAIEHYEEFKSSPKIVPHSIPILHFGDIEAYERSGLKIITVGLNPSLAEFSKNENRFGHEVRESLNPATLRLALSNYFKINPYRRWFNRSYEGLLQHFGASFYGEQISDKHSAPGVVESSAEYSSSHGSLHPACNKPNVVQTEAGREGAFPEKRHVSLARSGEEA